MRLRVLFNPAAGRGRAKEKIGRALRHLERRGGLIDFHQTRNPEDMIEKAAASNGNCDRLVVCGGDGSLHLALRRLDLGKTVVALLPFGSGDDFAQTVGVPRDTASACDTVFDGVPREVDVALVNGTRYVCVAGLGFDSVVTSYANRIKRLRGPLVYLAAIARVLPSLKPYRVRLSVDGIEREENIMFAVVANSPRYGAGIRIAPSAEVDDRMLDLTLVRSCSRMRLLATLPKAYSGRHVESPFVETMRGTHFRFESGQPLDVYADGELVATTPVEMSLAPDRLRVVVPRV